MHSIASEEPNKDGNVIVETSLLGLQNGKFNAETKCFEVLVNYHTYCFCKAKRWEEEDSNSNKITLWEWRRNDEGGENA